MKTPGECIIIVWHHLLTHGVKESSMHLLYPEWGNTYFSKYFWGVKRRNESTFYKFPLIIMKLIT